MPWRKYMPVKGKNGLIYHIGKGVVVRKNKREKWAIFIEKNGIRKSMTVGEGRDGLAMAIKAAEKIVADLDAVLKNGNVAKAKPQTPKFEDYSKMWLKANTGKWDENTLERYESMMRIHLFPDPNIKGKSLGEITRLDVKNCMRSLLTNRSASSVEIAYTVFNGVFEEAVDDEIIPAHPAQKLLKAVLPPKAQRSVLEPDPMTREERDLFLFHAEKMCSRTEQIILKMMVHGGFRLGEALAMKERHLDFRTMTYRICESFKLKRFTKPKKGKKRLVDLPNFLVDELHTYVTYLKKQALKDGHGGQVDLLFQDPVENGTWPYSQRKIQGLMKKVCRKAGLRVRNPHDLRHTYATIMLMAHQSPAYVQKQLGHSSIKTTVDIYGHWVSGQGRKGLEDALTGGTEIEQKTQTNANEQGRLQ